MDCASSPNSRVLRAKLALNGCKIRQFAKRFRFSEATVKAAIAGTRKGPKSRKIIARINAL